MKVTEKTGKTVDEAIDSALQELGISRDKAEITVVEEPNKGLFGFLGTKLAKVKVAVKEEEKPIISNNSKENILENENKPEKQIINNEETIIEAKKLLVNIFKSMDIEVQIEILRKEDHVHVNLIGSDLGILIGRRGDTLDAMQYLVNLAVNRNKVDRTRFILDVEGYRGRREKTLQNLAMKLADKAKRKGQNVVLEPMNPHERRIIHTALQDVQGISTRSEGDEPYRKIVIIPKR